MLLNPRRTEIKDVVQINSPFNVGSCHYVIEYLIQEPIKTATHSARYIFKEIENRSIGDVEEIGFGRQLRGYKEAVSMAQWSKHLCNRFAPANVEALAETLEAVLDAVAEFGPSSLKLNNLDPAEIQAEHLAAILRMCSSWRRDVVGWSEALEIAISAIKLAGEDPRDILFGMLK